MSDFAKILSHWKNRPDIFVEQIFNVITFEHWERLGSPKNVAHQEKWQTEALRDLTSHNRHAIKSGKGVGKSAFLSWSILWFLATSREVKIPCTATSSHQLFDVLWMECAKWSRCIQPQYLPYIKYIIKTDRIELEGMESHNFAIARTARRDQPEALQGFHAKNLLFVVDEASGVDDLIFEVAEGGMSTEGAKTILTGNPTRDKGYFFDAFHRDRGRWHCRTVSCRESSQVTQDYIDGMESKWGVDSNEFRVGVLGEFPLAGSNTIIPLALVETAIGRNVIDQRQPIWGVDVARFGSDRTALAKRRGRVLTDKIKFWQGKDIMQTAGIICDDYYATATQHRPSEIMIDAIGMGAGLYDRLRELKLPVRAINVAERKSVSDGYLMLRDELWFRAREWFENADVCIANDPDLIAELTSVEYDINSNGKKFVINKKALGWSPDLADAFVLTFASWKEKHALNQVALPQQQVYIKGDASYLDEYR